LQHVDVDLQVALDFGALDVPDAAQRRIAMQALRRIIGNMDGGDLEPGDGDSPWRIQTRRPPPRSLDHALSSEHEWVRPAGIDMRVIKSAHRVVEEIAKRGASGKPVLAAELVQDGLVSAPTMSRLLRNDETAGQYLTPYMIVSTSGRTKALDLTPKGRLLASKIRAGVVPS
jgi:hypothetical protein